MPTVASGRCTCGACRYSLSEQPLVVHACHCSWCQRETGTAFALNGWIEAKHVHLESGETIDQTLPSESGTGQILSRCSACQIVLWSVYGSGPKFRFVRLGTLDNPGQFEPEVHIFTSTKVPWLTLPEGVPSFPEFYRRSEVWRPESLERRKAVLAES